ncbi:hypothetical protein PMm318_A27500 [Pseudomonas moorei]
MNGSLPDVSKTSGSGCFGSQKVPCASLLATDVNDNAGCLNNRGAREFIASRLAPAGAGLLIVAIG